MEERTFNNRQRSTARLLFIVCCLLFIIPSESAVAQKKRTAKPAVPVEEQVQAAFAAYDFEGSGGNGEVLAGELTQFAA